ncbi:MAG TPA: hypothetical protein VF883_05505 [Thermoanaerobaculia bacterium]|jgi:hypothetical protein
MKHNRFFAILFAVAAFAAIPAFGASSLLTPDGVRYSVEMSADLPHVEIARAEGEERARLTVPSTQDATRESQAQLAYDSATDTLFVVWTRESDGVGEVRYATLSPAGHWSPARLVAAGSTMYRGLQFVLTHDVNDGVDATLMHVAWWSINGNLLTPEYALFAFENGRLVSAEQENLDDLAGLANARTANDAELEIGSELHPPLALDRSGNSVDVAFGSPNSTTLTRVNVVTRKIGVDVRIWKPLGRMGGRTPRSGLTSVTSAPVRAYMDKGHLALYTIDEELRFVVLRNNGTWSPVRTLRVDEDNTAADLLRDLEKTVEDLLDDESESEVESSDAPVSR